MENAISSYCRIKDNTVWLNGSLYFEGNKEEELNTFLNSLYKKTELNYPKFFKMDKLCKLGLLAAELIVRAEPALAEFEKQKIALVFANAASSLESDRSHAAAIADKSHYFPSPSVFVYTLPNIVIGEIAIKHKITGENAFFISEHFEAKQLQEYCELLTRNDAADAVICGWVNVDGEAFDAFAYCVKNLNFKQEIEEFPLPHQAAIIQQLYTTSYGSTGHH